MIVAFAIAAICLSAPVSGPVTAGFAPEGEYAGHWGVDYGASLGEEVRSPVSGSVTFAGSVAGMRTVTIEPVTGIKVSVSYLSEIRVTTGERVRRGEVVGLAGSPHGTPGVHMSTRIDGRYVDPRNLLGCAHTDISRALRLVTPPQSPPRRRMSTQIDKRHPVNLG
jgi:septal ring factor EnvC (AmiA/AmiB activator)